MTISGGSSSCTHSWTHDVFLSFRGPDTRCNFTCHLRNYLLHKGISTFIDDDELERGKQITPALKEAIEKSRISVIVFSENYASSEWCLEELAHILDCRKSKNQTVYPVFYKVTPSDVRHQKGSFGTAFDDLKCRSDSEKLRWKGALEEASQLAGWTYSDGYESTFIDTIVEKISMQVCCHADYIVADYPVGIECRLKEMHDLLDVNTRDVRVIGIWGIAGIGKTTIAKAVYNSLACRFDGCCFLENVAKISKQRDGTGSAKLRKMLLSKIQRVKDSELMAEACEGRAIKNRCYNRKVLLILDDVDESKQLSNLVGDRETEWFGLGSRIIITTRDKRVLESHMVVEVDRIYKPKELDGHEALKLFREKAFRKESVPDGYAGLTEVALEYCQGLPLALRSFGELLYDRTVEQWREELSSHKKCLDNDRLYETLISSFDALESSAKEAFLDIACFFNGKREIDVRQSLALDRKPINSIKVLEEKALLYIEDDRIRMHNLLEKLGKKIVEKESNEPGKRSRLWLSQDVYEILSERKGTDQIKGTGVVSGKHSDEILGDNCFLGMTNLQYIIRPRDCSAEFSGDIAYLPNALTLIDWPNFPFTFLPHNYEPKKLVNLNMPGSRISDLGNKFKLSKHLKYINLEGCESLVQIPNFAGSPKLVALSLSGCHQLDTFPTIDQEKKFLTLLDLSGTGIRELPDASVRYLPKLDELYLSKCRNLESLPNSIYDLKHLKDLDIHDCSNLVTLPQWNEAVNLRNLNNLDLRGCERLRQIPELPPTVKLVNVADCVQLEIFAKLSNIIQRRDSRMMERITLTNCEALRDSLIREMEIAKRILRSQVSLCSLFLSCRQSEFEVVFPGSEVPQWFTCTKKLREPTGVCKFSIDLPLNYNSGNQGLAICAAAEVVNLEGVEGQSQCSVKATIDIIAESRSFDFNGKGMKSDHVWLCYIPFITGRHGPPSPPYICGVTFEHNSQGSMQSRSYGVHLVTGANLHEWLSIA